MLHACHVPLFQTREELRESLNAEMRAFMADRVCVIKRPLGSSRSLALQDGRTDVDISWNHLEFEVQYDSLDAEIKIGACTRL